MHSYILAPMHWVGLEVEAAPSSGYLYLSQAG